MQARKLWLPVALLSLGLAAPAGAGHHRWDLSELFSSADGTVQFIEMFSANPNEHLMNGFTITVAGGGTFTFVGNLPSSATTNTWLLVATTAFAALPGAPPPDYVLPDGFLPTGGGSLNYAGVDFWNYPALPTDGVSSLDRDPGDTLNGGIVATNSPTAFPTNSGSVVVGAPVPSLSGWGAALLVGAMLFAVSGVHRRRAAAAA